MASVNSLGELLSALADESIDFIQWTGPSYVANTVLDVSGDVSVPAYPIGKQGKVIDFDGLVIDTVELSPNAKTFGDPTATEVNSVNNLAWTFGFRVFGRATPIPPTWTHDETTGEDVYHANGGYLDTDYAVTVKNLTVNHLILSHPRDIIATGTFINCYFYDIYAPSCDMNSWWLKGSGMLDNSHAYYNLSAYGWRNKPRVCSNYVFGYHARWYNSEYSIHTPEDVTKFYYCIVNIRTENAGITFPRAVYVCCELGMNYELNWDYQQAMQLSTVEYDNLVLFPAPSFSYLMHSDLKVNVTLNSEWPLKISDCYYDVNSQWLSHFKTVYWVKESVIDIAVNKGKNAPNASVIENADLFLDTVTKDPDGAGGRYGLAFVTNGGDIHLLETTPEAAQVLYGDLRNPDIMTQHGCHFIEDDGERKAQYDLPITDYQGGSYIGFDDDETWYRRRYAGTNDGIPFLPFWYYPYHDTPSGGGTAEGEYISVYDMDTEQDGFDNNGLILEPTQCRVVEELNGAYNLTLEHPYDTTGKWQHILEHNIIKCMGQLFIIRKVTSTNKANSKSVSAYAEHISYHLNDYWLFPGTSIAGYIGQTLIDSILAQMWDVPWDIENNLRYTFDIKTNLSADPTFREWYEMPEGHTPYEMILGSNGFTSLIGGELYRDNFKISIYNRMEGSENEAFVIHPDLNLKSIQKTVDLQTFCTYFRGYDPYGNWFAIAWDPRTLPRAYPHNVVRSQNFSFDVAEEYYDFAMLARKTGEYFKRMCAPLISFRIQVQDLKNYPEYREFVNNYRFKVGDIGKVWDDDAGKYYELEITRTVKDGITGECLEVVIGTERSFTRPNTTPITIDRNYITVEAGEYHPDDPDPEPEPPSIEDYVWTQDDDKADIIYYIGDGRNIVIPYQFATATLQTIRATAFCDNQNRIVKVTIPEGTEAIE